MSRPYDPEKHTAEVNHLEVAISRESYDPKNAVIDYDLDPFAIQEAQKADDYLEFRSLGWFKAGLLASAEFLAIGMLSYPSIFMRLGMVGGILATLAFSIFAYICAWIIVDFKCRHMGVMNYADAGFLLFGRAGQLVVGTMLVVKSMFLAGSHAVVGAEAFSVMTNHKICNVWWALIVTVISMICSLPREWNKLGFLSFASVACIIVAAIMTAIVSGTQDPATLTKGGAPIVWHAVAPNTTFLAVSGGITNTLFCYGGAQSIFAFVSEMKRPQDFKKSFAFSMSLGVVMQGVIGATIYSFTGQYTTSPALTVVGHKFQIAAYSIAMVTIIISGVVAVNVGVKYLYVNLLRNSPLLTSMGWRARLIWVGIIVAYWTVGFIVSMLVPFFNDLLSIITALTSVWFSYGFCAFLWLYDNHPVWAKSHETHVRRLNTPVKWFWMTVCVLAVLLSLYITPTGLYSAAIGIRDGYKKGRYHHPFAC